MEREEDTPAQTPDARQRRQTKKAQRMSFQVNLDAPGPRKFPGYRVYRVYTRRRVGAAPLIVEEELVTARSFSSLWQKLKRIQREDRARLKDAPTGGSPWERAPLIPDQRCVRVYAADSLAELSSPSEDEAYERARDALKLLASHYGNERAWEVVWSVLTRAQRGRPRGFDAEDAPKMRLVLRRIVKGAGPKEAIQAELGRKVGNIDWPHPLYKKLQRYCEAAYDVWLLAGEPDLASRQPVSAGVKAEFWTRLKMELPRDSKIAAKAVELHYKAIISGERKDQVEIDKAGGPPPPEPRWKPRQSSR